MHLLPYLSTNSLRILYCVLNPGLQHPLHACGCAAGTQGVPVEPLTGTASFCPSYSKVLPDKWRRACLSISVCSAQWRARCEDGVYSKTHPRYRRSYPWPSALKWAKLALEQLSCDLVKPSLSYIYFFLKECSLDCLFIRLFLEILLHSTVQGWLAWNLRWSQSAPECCNRRHAAPCPASNLL